MYIFCEDRTRPITSKEELGYIKKNNGNHKGEARPGEIYTYQLCISDDMPLSQVNLTLEELISEDGSSIIPIQDMTCYNIEGIDANGNTFKHQGIDIEDYQVFWIGVGVSEKLQQGTYRGKVGVSVEGVEVNQVTIELLVTGEALEHQGHDDLWRLSRLQWLNSTIAQDGQVTKDFDPVTMDKDIITIKGRKITVGDTALPTQITSYFNESVSEVIDKGNDILRGPITFDVLSSGEEALNGIKAQKLITSEKVTVTSQLTSKKLDIEHHLQVEYDGFMSLKTTVQAKEDILVHDMQFRVPFTAFASTYSMGLGQEGGRLRPVDFHWNDQHQDTLWVGNINGGLSCTFKDEQYIRPFVNVYYNQRKRSKPTWDNEGMGHIELIKEEIGSTLMATTGSMTLQAGERKTYIVDFYITPFKAIDYCKHWQTRYYHPHENARQTDWLAEMDDLHCNYLNIHHGQELHPFINYPFIEVDPMKAFITEAHNKGKKVKLYYTLREITNHFKELWPFYSLGEEIFPKHNPDEVLFWKAIDPSKWLEDNLLTGKRKMWVEENIDEELIPAWQHVFHHGKYQGQTCASILVEPISRLNNFYLEGLNWLVKNMDMDGIYIDDVAYDRKTIQRVRKILDQKENAYIDFHSWNHMNEHAGMVNCALLYKELLPYVDSIWFGEGFDYDKDPDYWMVEMSGMPFGLMSEMLQNDGHLYRGMVYGMTNRTGWGSRQPTAIYKLWDDFHIEESQMRGYWENDCPVTVNHHSMRATAYVKDDAVLVAIGSWSESDEVISLEVDWNQLGLDQHYVTTQRVELVGYQEEDIVDIDALSVEAERGLILLIKQ